jgi:membrane protein implicated in regulation of membrane protease activity
MPEWVYWIIGSGVLAVGEMVSLSFFMGPIAIAAALAALTSLLGGGVALQIVVFIVSSAASLAVLRPIARRHLMQGPRTRTGAAALIGAPALVLEPVSRDGGQVKIGGEIWTARTYDEDDVIEPGKRVQVLKIDGATALVSDGID